MTTQEIGPDHIAGLRRSSLIAGVAALIAWIVCGLFGPPAFFHAYLYAYLFWLGLALGSLGLLMLHHITGGGWGFVIRRILEAAAMTLPVLAALFVPLCFGIRFLYSWTDPAAVAADPVLQHRSALFTAPWFVGRAVLYFACWIGLALSFRRWSLAQDRTGAPELTRRFQQWSGPGLVLFVFTASQAAVDWIMTLEPHWYSTVFGMLIIVGHGLTGLAFAILIALWLAGRRRFEVAGEQFHDLGGLLLAFVALWLYLAYAQYIIIWSGDLPHEISFYVHRRRGGWSSVAFAIILFHFAVPFTLLLFGGVKRNMRLLGAVALLILSAHLVDIYWTVRPTFHPSGFVFGWSDLFAPIAIGGLWLAEFARNLHGTALIPLHDPRLEEAEARRELERAREALDRG